MKRILLLILASNITWGSLLASTVTFQPVPGTGPAVPLSIEISDSLAGVRIMASVEGAPVGDIRGLFFELSGLAGLACSQVSGLQMTGCSVSPDGVGSIGPGVNMDGLGVVFDFGILIGSPGIGVDDVQHAIINIENPLLSAAHFTAAGARLTSVGSERADSSKLYDGTPDTMDTPEPSTGTLFGAAGLLVLAARRLSSRLS